jgi:hypothetical protein
MLQRPREDDEASAESLVALQSWYVKRIRGYFPTRTRLRPGWCCDCWETEMVTTSEMATNYLLIKYEYVACRRLLAQFRR